LEGTKNLGALPLNGGVPVDTDLHEGHHNLTGKDEPPA